MNRPFLCRTFLVIDLKILCLLILILSFVMLNAENQIIKVGVYNNSPKIFMYSQDKASGIYIDIIEIIAEEENWEIEYVEGTWEECLNNLHTGEIDIMPDVAYSPEREQLYSFHKTPVLSSWSPMKLIYL